MAIIGKVVSHIRKRKAIPCLLDSIEHIEDWFQTPLGQQLLKAERRLVNEELNCMFGYHLMQLSVNRQTCLFEESRINHCFSMGVGPTQGETSIGAYSELDSLPLEDEVVDVTILHHVLEFSSNPHQVLKEAARVTIPRGYIIVIGFNPFSAMGAIKPFAQLYSKSPIWKRQSLRKSRISDWLKLLDCNTVRSKTGLHNLPLQNTRYLKYINDLGRRFRGQNVPFGNFYCLVARKDRVCMTPLKPDWAKETRFKASKPALSARSAARLALIKSDKPSLPD